MFFSRHWSIWLSPKLLLTSHWKSLILENVTFEVCLTHDQMISIRLFQTERVCRWQFQIWRKWQKAIQTGRKHCGKRRNWSLQAISPFPTLFSKGLFPNWASKGVIVWEWVNPFPNKLIWNYSPEFKEGADDNWNVAIKWFKDTDHIENIVEKGEIAHFEQFHLFPQCFPKAFFFAVLKWVYMQERVNSITTE